jgi:hypothetical protein
VESHLKEMPKTELAIVPAEQPKEKSLSRRGNFAPTNMTEALQFAKLIANSDLAPKDYRNKPANVLVAMQMGAEVGLAPMQALQNIAVINGRPSLWGDAALAVVQVHPDYEWHKEWIDGDGDKKTAHCQVKRKGQEISEGTFSIAQATKAGLTNKEGTWRTYQDRMLQMRARGFALRDRFADDLRGLILAEEAMDIPPDVTPRKERGALDADALSTLTESSEPNRGHGQEGMQKAEPKSEPSRRLTRGVVTVTKIDAKMKKPTQAQLDKAKADKKAAPEPRPYFVLTCGDSEGNSHEIASWDTKHHEHILRAQNKVCDFTIAANDKGDRIFYNLEHIHRIGELEFENDAPVVPAEQGELQQPTGEELFDK